MSRYLTVNQWLRADEGLATANLPPNTIKRFITRAEAMIDAYVGIDARHGGFEPHVIWEQCQWDRRSLRTWLPNWPVPVRNCVRYRIQVSMQGSNVPNGGFFANINTGDVAYNVFDNYLEIVPLQAIMYSMLPVLVELGLSPPLVQMDAEVGYFIDQLGEILDDAGDHTTYYAQRGMWATSYTTNLSIWPNTVPVCAKAVAPTSTQITAGYTWTTNPGSLPYIVRKNGTPVTSGITVDVTEGSVTFAAANAATDVITLDYTYTIPDPIKEAAIAQTTYLLALRAATQQGLRVAESIQTDQQTIVRYNRKPFGMQKTDEPVMDPTAQQLLTPYRQFAIAGG